MIAAASVAGCSGRGDSVFIERYITSQKVIDRNHDQPSADAPATTMMDTSQPIGADEETPTTKPVDIAPSKTGEPVPWAKRRGPAYADDFWRSFGRDGKEMPATIWDDTKATFTDPWTLVAMGGAVAAGNDVISGAMYFGSLAAGDVKTYETSKALINALAINGLTTLALKGITNNESPNGDPFGWPSGHTSSTFCLATVMHEAYGPKVGIPLFVFASFVGYERIDARNHDFNDVISGAIIGIAIGHAVMQNHQPKILGFDVIPWSDPARNAVGIALMKEF
jgi:hypothetical protein